MDWREHNDLISVVIPLFNAEKFLQPLMDSIIQQTYTNWEVIFVDDGSQDNSAQVVRNQIVKDQRFRLLSRPENEPKGAPTCRNIGMREARGEYVIFFDADDIIADYCFEQRLEGIKESGKDFCVFPLMSFERELFDMSSPIVLGFPTTVDTFYCLIARMLPFCVVTNIYRRSALLDKNIMWDVKVKSLQDSDFNVTCISKELTYSIANAKPDYYWRLGGNDNSISKMIKKTLHADSHLYLLEKEYEMLKGKGYDDAVYSFFCFILDSFVSYGDVDAIEKLLHNKYLNENPFIRLRMKILWKLMGKDLSHYNLLGRKARIFLFPRLELKSMITGHYLDGDIRKYLIENKFASIGG